MPAESRPEPITRCAHCRGPMPDGRRPDARYCGQLCKRAAWQDHARQGHVKRFSRLASGRYSVVVYLESDIGLRPGQTVRIGEV